MDESQARTDAVRALEQEFAELFASARRLFADAAERAHPGMQPSTYRILSSIARREPIAASVIADTLDIDRAHVSRMVKDLTTLGFITSEPDPNDGRGRLLSATPLGNERLAAGREPMRDRFAEVMRAWHVGEIEAFARLLHAFTEGSHPSR